MSTRGEHIKNEKATPIGTPALLSPTNNGIDEQEQKGDIIPNIAPTILPLTPLYLESIFFVLSGGK